MSLQRPFVCPAWSTGEVGTIGLLGPGQVIRFVRSAPLRRMTERPIREKVLPQWIEPLIYFFADARKLYISGKIHPLVPSVGTICAQEKFAELVYEAFLRVSDLPCGRSRLPLERMRSAADYSMPKKENCTLP